MTHFSVCVYIHDLATAHTCNKLSSLNTKPHFGGQNTILLQKSCGLIVFLPS